MKPVLMGAMIGAASSAVMGKDPLKGAVMGGVGGGLSSAFSGADALGGGLELPLDSGMTGIDLTSMNPTALSDATKLIDPNAVSNVGIDLTGNLDPLQSTSDLFANNQTVFDPSGNIAGVNMSTPELTNLMGAESATNQGLLNNVELPKANKNIFGFNMDGVPTDIAETPGLLQNTENRLQKFGEDNPMFVGQLAYESAQPEKTDPIQHQNIVPFKSAQIDVDKYDSFGVTPRKRQQQSMYRNIPLNA